MLMTGPEREVVGLRWDWWRVFGWERVRVVVVRWWVERGKDRE
jgi:hypothetical protein